MISPAPHYHPPPSHTSSPHPSGAEEGLRNFSECFTLFFSRKKNELFSRTWLIPCVTYQSYSPSPLPFFNLTLFVRLIICHYLVKKGCIRESTFFFVSMWSFLISYFFLTSAPIGTMEVHYLKLTSQPPDQPTYQPNRPTNQPADMKVTLSMIDIYYWDTFCIVHNFFKLYFFLLAKLLFLF